MKRKTMEDDQYKENYEANLIWIDWENKVISFTEVDGFEKLEFPTHREMFAFAIARGSEDFGIQ